MIRGLIGAALLVGGAAVPCPRVTRQDAARIARSIGIQFSQHRFGLEQFRRGLAVELEHGPCGPGGRATDVTHGDLVATGRIAYAHLLERPDYYERLARYVER